MWTYRVSREISRIAEDPLRDHGSHRMRGEVPEGPYQPTPTRIPDKVPAMSEVQRTGERDPRADRAAGPPARLSPYPAEVFRGFHGHTRCCAGAEKRGEA